MNAELRKGALGGSVAIAALLATPAFATGTETVAGTKIQNTAYVDFTIGGIAQTQKASNTNEFLVDQKVNFSIVESDNQTFYVSPSQTSAVTTFDVTNLSNSVIDIGLLAAQLGGGTAIHGGTDSFDVTNVTIYVDSDNSGDYTPGVDQAVSYLDEMAIDETRRVFIVANIPANAVTDDVAGVVLTGTAQAGGSVGAPGAVLANTVGGDTAGIDTVLADSGLNGIESAQDDYTVLAAAIAAAKYSRVVYDPINGTDNPKMIPGAVVEYCIAVVNGGGATASNVVVTDPVPANTTYLASFGVKTNGTSVVGGVCDPGLGNGSLVGSTVTGALVDLAPSQTRTVVFQVTIN